MVPERKDRLRIIVMTHVLRAVHRSDLQASRIEQVVMAAFGKGRRVPDTDQGGSRDTPAQSER